MNGTTILTILSGHGAAACAIVSTAIDANSVVQIPDANVVIDIFVSGSSRLKRTING
jgi:hypothetical protein